MSRRVGNRIFGWDESYEVDFFGEPDNKRYYGVELEIDDGSLQELRRRFNGNEELDDKLFLVEDGSLDNGIEIVTNPMSLNYHMTTDLWEVITQESRRAGFKSHDTDTCGLHIHVSKESLSEEVIDNILFLNERFWLRWVNFSRRTEESIRSWSRKLTEYKDAEVTKNRVKNRENKGKYSSINLSNDNTIEFRLFRGTLEKRTILATLSMIDYMISFAEKYTSNNNLDIEKVTWVDFVKGISEQDTTLTDYLDKRGLYIVCEEEDKKEEEERAKAILSSKKEEIKEVYQNIFSTSAYNPELYDNNIAMSNFVEGYCDSLHRLVEDRNVGDLLVLTDVDNNRYGRGSLDNFEDVLTVASNEYFLDSDDEDLRGAYVWGSNMPRYSFSDDITSKLIPINETTVVSKDSGVEFDTYKYATLDIANNLVLVELTESNLYVNKTYVVGNTVDLVYSDGTSDDSDSFINSKIDKITEIMDRIEDEDITLEEVEGHLEWLKEVYAELKGSSQVIETDEPELTYEVDGRELHGVLEVVRGGYYVEL